MLPLMQLALPRTQSVTPSPNLPPISLGQGWFFDEGTTAPRVAVRGIAKESPSNSIDVSIGQIIGVEEVVKHFQISAKAQADFAVFGGSGSVAYALDQASRAEL